MVHVAFNKTYLSPLTSASSCPAQLPFPCKVLTAEGKQGKWPANLCVGKHRHLGNFSKTQEISGF